MTKRGFTLIEVVVVAGVLSTLALFGIVSIIEFQKNSILENTAKELVSTIRTAQNKSLAGELLPGESPVASDLPKYGVAFTADSYTLVRIGSSAIETYPINNQLHLTSFPASIAFDRISGLVSGTPPSTEIIISRKSGGSGRKIEINSQGLVKSTRI